MLLSYSEGVYRELLYSDYPRVVNAITNSCIAVIIISPQLSTSCAEESHVPIQVIADVLRSRDRYNNSGAVKMVMNV